MKSVLAGLASLGAFVAALAYLVPEEQLPLPMWLFVYLALAACAWFCWRHPKAPTSPKGWLEYVGGAVLCGAILTGIDAVLHGPKSGHIVLDLSLSGLGCIVAMSGVAYSWAASKRDSA